MKRAIIAAIAITASIFTAPAQATDFCVTAYDLVVRLGKNRDAGVPMKSLMDEAAEIEMEQLRSWVKDTVGLVYSYPEVPIQKMAADVYKGCREPASKSKTVAPGTNRGGV
jgi:hypothetical protein